MNPLQKQFLRFALATFKSLPKDKRIVVEQSLDEMYVKLTVIPIQKAFREKYPPHDTSRQFCPNPLDCHFEYGKTPYLQDGYCPICDDSCFCHYCGKVIAGTANWDLVGSAFQHLCSICRREEELEDYKNERAMR